MAARGCFRRGLARVPAGCVSPLEGNPLDIEQCMPRVAERGATLGRRGGLAPVAVSKRLLGRGVARPWRLTGVGRLIDCRSGKKSKISRGSASPAVRVPSGGVVGIDFGAQAVSGRLSRARTGPLALPEEGFPADRTRHLPRFSARHADLSIDLARALRGVGAASGGLPDHAAHALQRSLVQRCPAPAGGLLYEERWR